MTLTYFLSFY